MRSVSVNKHNLSYSYLKVHMHTSVNERVCKVIFCEGEKCVDADPEYLERPNWKQFLLLFVGQGVLWSLVPLDPLLI